MNMFLARQKGFFSFVSIVFLICIALLPINAHAVVGKAEFVLGKVQLVTINGQTILLKRGMGVNVGDKVVTKEKGQVMLRMIDKSKISVRPNSKIIIKNYSYKQNSKKDTAQYELLAGTFRAITGVIGKANKKAFKLKTPVGTLGIRGTDFVARYSNDGFYVDVNAGGVRIANKTGVLDVNPGEYGHIADVGMSPVLVSELPKNMLVMNAANTKRKKLSMEQEMVAVAIKYGDGDTRAVIDELIKAQFPGEDIVDGAAAMGLDEAGVIEQMIDSSSNSRELIEQLIKSMPRHTGSIVTMAITKDILDLAQAANLMESSGSSGDEVNSSIALGNLLKPPEEESQLSGTVKNKTVQQNQLESDSQVQSSTGLVISDPKLIPGDGKGGGEDASPE